MTECQPQVIASFVDCDHNYSLWSDLCRIKVKPKAILIQAFFKQLFKFFVDFDHSTNVIN